MVQVDRQDGRDVSEIRGCAVVCMIRYQRSLVVVQAHKHSNVRVLGQSTGHYEATAATTNNDDVVIVLTLTTFQAGTVVNAYG